MVVHVFKPSTLETETGGSLEFEVRLHSEILSWRGGKEKGGEGKREERKINLFLSVHSMITIEYSIHDGHLIFSE